MYVCEMEEMKNSFKTQFSYNDLLAVNISSYMIHACNQTINEYLGQIWVSNKCMDERKQENMAK